MLDGLGESIDKIFQQFLHLYKIKLQKLLHNIIALKS